jgi:hypothetical protein
MEDYGLAPEDVFLSASGARRYSNASRSHKQRFNLHSSCLLHVWQNMRVDFERKCHRGVPKLFAHDLWRDAGSQT